MTGVEIDIIKRVELVTLKIFCGISHTQFFFVELATIGNGIGHT